MIQVFLGDEKDVNKFLRENVVKIEVISTDLSLDEHGECVMVTYKDLEYKNKIDEAVEEILNN